ncbi:MAG: carboxypeptidase-like regulatory domain-containing protein [Patescibacteria group bacterium]|nr:carboxypeptidase-like regulatory domain-containing protein [Patescibacteria group bacterium]
MIDGPPRNPACVLPLGLLLFLAVSPAAAHSLHLFAEGHGTVIRGKAYFRGGSPAANLQITAFDPGGRAVGDTKTDTQGTFTFDAPFRCDYRLLATTSDGHGAEFLVSAAELSAELPLPEPAGNSPNGGTPAEPPPANPALAELGDDPGTTGPLADELRGLRVQLTALRQQMAEYEQRTRLRDVLGGIGYILGLAGLAFYLAARRARGRRAP